MAYRPSKRPSISVVMTLRDADATLGRAVESVLAQSFTDVQLVLAVLPSGDGTLAHARRLEERDIRVDVVEVDEDASVDALDAGVDAARGEYLLFMGQRDWLGVHALALLAHAIEDGSVDLAVPVFSSANPPAPVDAEEADRIVVLDRDQVRAQAHRFIVNEGFGTLHGKMLRRDRVQSLGIRHVIAGDDEAYLITYLEDLDSLAICPGAVYHDEGPLRIDGRTDPLARCEYDHQLMLELAERWGMADDRKLLEAVHLLGRQHLGQPVVNLRRLKQLRWVVGDVAVGEQEAVERPHAAQYAALRARAYADVVQRGGKGLQVLQSGVLGAYAFGLEKAQQLVYVAHVGVERVGREVALKFHVAAVGFGHIRQLFVFRFHLFSYFCKAHGRHAAAQVQS